MANKMKVDIVSAEGEIFAGEAEMLFVPAREGELGITPRHAPLLSMIKAGEVRIKNGDDEQSIFVGGGALEVQPHRVTVLADTAIRAKDIDEAAAKAAKQRAEEAIASNIDKLEQAEAMAELVRATEQLRILEKLRKIRG
jgi:F-type H+-transporting ATPase subunit epsilon